MSLFAATMNNHLTKGVAMTHYVEMRSYSLKPHTRDEFHRLLLEKALLMLQRWKVDVVAYGPSLHDSDSYFLMRRYDSLARSRRARMPSTGARNGGRVRVKPFWL